MSPKLPRSTSREIAFTNGVAIGMSHRWEGGQYCSLLTAAGIVGCGIYDMLTPAEFGQAIAIARGTPQKPLVEPEDLFNARIVDCTPKARTYGIEVGMTGREAVELMLRASEKDDAADRPHTRPATAPIRQAAPAIRVMHIDHVTLVVADLDRSRAFYVGVLGMKEVPRPSFGFPGLWFQAGSTQIHLILEHPESGPAKTSIPENCSISRTRHFAFEVASAEAAVAQLAMLGIPLAAGPKRRPDGPTQLYVQDPDGNLVELFSQEGT